MCSVGGVNWVFVIGFFESGSDCVCIDVGFGVGNGK